MRAIAAVLLGVLGLAAAAAGTVLAGAAFDDLERDALRSFSRVRDLDEISRHALGESGGERALTARLVKEAMDASDAPEAQAALGAAGECLAKGSCSPALAAELKPLEKIYLERIAREYANARARSDQGRWLSLAGLVAALAGAALGFASSARRRGAAPAAGSEVAAQVLPLQAVLKSRLEELYQLRLRAWENDRFAAYGELASGLSHGLKTPLATIRAAAQVAQAKLGTAHPAAANLEEIVGEIDALVDQIRRFLKATGTGLPVLVPIHPRRLLDALARAYASDAAERGVAVRVEASDAVPHVAVDPALVEMALRNVVENAFAVAPRGSTVVAGARPCEAPERAGLDKERPAPGGQWVEISIADEGPGLPATVSAGAPVASSKPEGSGLGLAIARQIFARHGGVLLFAARPEGGTVVRALLPAAEAQPGPA